MIKPAPNPVAACIAAPKTTTAHPAAKAVIVKGISMTHSSSSKYFRKLLAGVRETPAKQMDALRLGTR
ncbi:hypothetical protein JCM17960_27290 [Magnetospira thiophila]